MTPQTPTSPHPGLAHRRRSVAGRVAVLAAALAVMVPLTWASPLAAPPVAASSSIGAAAAGAPNIFFYNLDDLRDEVPGGIDPLQFMPKLRQWMSAGSRYTKMFVAEPSCCPSRSSLMTGRYPHNNGVRFQAQGPAFDLDHSMASYLKAAGYSTYMAGKFLTTWPKDRVPPFFDHSTVMWSGYTNVNVRVDGKLGTGAGYSTSYLGAKGREYITSALALGKPFLLYETPMAPHWVEVLNPDGTTVRRAVPSATYANSPVGNCAGPRESDRSDKPPYVLTKNFSAAAAQVMCESQMRTIMTADDEFGATMQLLSDRGALANTLVIFTSDNGFMWGEHGRTEKFVPYEPSMRVPLMIRWPGHIPAGTNTTRLVSYVDLLPTMLQAAGVTIPANAPPMDGESLFVPSVRTTVLGEYWEDPANGTTSTWKMIGTNTVKYIQTYDAAGAVTFTEYYNLVADPTELTNLLGDASTTNDPSASTVAGLRSRLNELASCAGSACVN